MKKAVKITALVLFLAFICIQFVRPERINVPIVPEQTLGSSAQVPNEIQKIFQRSCNDCHTNQTNWRWYSHVAPMSWGRADHVNEGRAELNFSEWANYETSRQRRKLKLSASGRKPSVPDWKTKKRLKAKI